MDKWQRISLVALRVALGWLMFYAGATKVLDPAWSAAGYMKGAKTFPWLYAWLAGPNLLPVVNFLNEWGLTLLGLSLMLGIFVRLSSMAGALLMVAYWLPVLDFPWVEHGFLVDDHIIYALALMYLAAAKAGRVWGLDKKCAALPVCAKYPKLRTLSR